VPPAKDESERQRIYYHRDDKHLQSTHDVTGYPIKAIDGEIGHVSSFLVDDRSWAIRDMVVETGHWYSGKEIRIPVGEIERISYMEAQVIVNLSKAEIERTPDHELAKAGTG
jgi:hypothetical protein